MFGECGPPQGRARRELREQPGVMKNPTKKPASQNGVRREDAWNGLSASTLPGTSMDLYEVEPEGAARGAVIVVQEAFGVTDHIKDVCRRFADAGYRAVAPHVFHRSGDPVLGYDEMDKVIPHIMELKADDLLADIDATVAYLGQAGFEPATDRHRRLLHGWERRLPGCRTSVARRRGDLLRRGRLPRSLRDATVGRIGGGAQDAVARSVRRQ